MSVAHDLAPTPQPPYPLHPSVRDRIAPDYAAFYDRHLADKQQVHLQSVEASRAGSRGGAVIPGAGPGGKVASARDHEVWPRLESRGPPLRVRAFTPEGCPPSPAGWPACLYFHGGGWVLGTIDTENAIATNLCERGGCVVVAVDYRLAPENRYPAAVEDSWEAVRWVQGEGARLLGLDTSRLAVGGSSAGGNLAAIMCQKAAALQQQQEEEEEQKGQESQGKVGVLPPPHFRLQLLSVPVTDNRAVPGEAEADAEQADARTGPSPGASAAGKTRAETEAETETTTAAYPSWRENAAAPALPAPKMLWYRRHYLPDPRAWSEPEASPLLWAGDWSRLPPAVVVVGELDVLRDEGRSFGERLRREGGVRADVHVMPGQPHPFIAMDGVLEAGGRAISLFCDALRRAMYGGGEQDGDDV